MSIENPDMKISVIDIGTNTFKLIIAQIDGTDFRVIHSEKQGVKLGEGSYRDKRISEAAILRAEKCIREFISTAAAYGSSYPKAFATAAVRDSANGEEFAHRLYLNTGLPINVIGGETEAELIATGVMSALSQMPEHFMIMDIGGGSTEFIQVKGQKVSWRKSFPLGASRLLQELNPADPVQQNDIEKLYELLEKELHELNAVIGYQPLELVGCSGSFETFSDMIQLEIKNEDALETSAVRLQENELDELFRTLKASARAERMKMKGLPEYRVDTIVYGSLLVQWFRDKFRPSAIHSSFRSMKEGIITEIINNRL